MVLENQVVCYKYYYDEGDNYFLASALLTFSLTSGDTEIVMLH